MHFSFRNFVVASLALFAFFFPQDGYAAETLISPSAGTHNTGQTFTANVRVNPKGQSVNAVEAVLTFDTSKLSVVSVGKTGSAFTLWTKEPTFSNTSGTIEFSGGSPTPFSTESTLVVVTFRAVAEGSASVEFKSASVLAADGRGTEVFSGSVKATYTISAASTPPPPSTTPATPTQPEEESSAAITFGDPPQAPEIGSKTFLDPELWYATSTGLFTWELPFDVNGMMLDIATSADSKPVTKYEPPISELLLTPGQLRDGIQYLVIQYKNMVGWGAITSRKIKIDTTPPESFTINIRAGDTPSTFPILVFDARDGTSGIEKYELTIADREPVTVTPDEARLGYLLSELVNGTYTITVAAYDKAGNKTISQTPVIITAGWQPKSETEESSSFFALFTFQNILITFLISVVIASLIYILYERRQFSRKETQLRKETKEIQDQMEKIFSALRDEIQDQIKSITKKPRLSKNERFAVENLESAIEVSETLIEKEIADVQKILK